MKVKTSRFEVRGRSRTGGRVEGELTDVYLEPPANAYRQHEGHTLALVSPPASSLDLQPTDF